MGHTDYTAAHVVIAKPARHSNVAGSQTRMSVPRTARARSVDFSLRDERLSAKSIFAGHGFSRDKQKRPPQSGVPLSRASSVPFRGLAHA
jgi:hypothetical protein